MSVPRLRECRNRGPPAKPLQDDAETVGATPQPFTFRCHQSQIKADEVMAQTPTVNQDWLFPTGKRIRVGFKSEVATDNTPATAALRRGRRATWGRWQPIAQRVCCANPKRQRYRNYSSM